MLWKTRELESLPLNARDGGAARIDDVYLSDDTWAVRYLVVASPEERVLISPMLTEGPDPLGRSLSVATLTCRLARMTPPRAREAAPGLTATVPDVFRDECGWPHYWMGDPATLAVRAPAAPGSPRLRSARELRGYRFENGLGSSGWVTDLIVDIRDWRVRYLEVRDEALGTNVVYPVERVEETLSGERILRANADVRSRVRPSINPPAPAFPLLEAASPGKLYGREPTPGSRG